MASFWIDRTAQAPRDGGQTPLGGPQRGIGGQAGRREQVRVDVTDTQAVPSVTVDEGHGFVVRGDRRLRQAPRQSDDLLALRQVAECELPGHLRITQDRSRLEQATRVVWPVRRCGGQFGGSRSQPGNWNRWGVPELRIGV